MIGRAFLITLALVACGGRVEPDSDAASHDASTDADTSSSSDATTSTSDGGGSSGIVCGPNTCHTGEICCNPKCGVCTFPDECVIHDCGGP